MSEKAANTRLKILLKAFELTYRRGYQATSVDQILAELQVTKGAFFYHFKTKDEMGLAMIREVLAPGMYHGLIHPLLSDPVPTNAIFTMMQGLLLTDPFFEIKYGCPAVNLIEEMSPINAEFKKELAKLTNQWKKTIEQCVVNGKEAGRIKDEINEKAVAMFIMSGYGGIRNLGKIYGKASYQLYLETLKSYLETLKK
jgi:TetR/AcrR family transcriptional regulator, transcriptional repressor for nem operon